ncbi:hypothetical protein AB8O38_00695 [Saccharomonospora xinjiangensis]
MATFPGVLTYVAFAAVLFFILYLVVKAAVRDGIREARTVQAGSKPEV